MKALSLLAIFMFSFVGTAQTPQFTYYNTENTVTNSINNNETYDVAQIANGEIWVVTNGDINIYQNGNWSVFTDVVDNFNGIEVAPNGDIWLISVNGGTHHFNGADWTHYTSSNGLQEDYVKDISINSNNHVLITHAFGFTFFDGNNFIYTPLSSFEVEGANQVSKGYLANNGDWWFMINGTPLYIAHYVNNTTLNVYAETSALPANLQKIDEDSQGNIYLAIYDSNIGGLFKFENDGFTPVQNGNISKLATGLSIGANDDIWYMATGANGGAYKINNGSVVHFSENNSLISNYNNNSINALPNGQVWISNLQNGAYGYNGSWVNYNTESGAGLPQNLTHNVVTDNNGKIWVSNNNNVTTYDGVSWQSFNLPSGINHNVFKNFYADNLGRLWMTTNANGIWLLQNGLWQELGIEAEFPNSSFTQIAMGNNGNIFICSNEGLFEFEVNNLSYTLHDIDPCIAITALNNGNLALSTIFGLYEFDITNSQFILIAFNDAFPQTAFPAIIDQHPDGSIWVMGSGYIAKYDGESIIDMTDTGFPSFGNDMKIDNAGRVFICTNGLTRVYQNDMWQNFTDPESSFLNSEVTSIAISPNNEIWFSGSNGLLKVVFQDIIANQVWAGDANADGVVDGVDVLYWGYAFNETGAVRENASIDWIGQDCEPWEQNFINGANFNNADCNGNGTVDYADTTAISQNFSLTHDKTDGQKSLAYQIEIVPHTESFNNVQENVFSIEVSEDGEPIENLHGVSFDLYFNDNQLEYFFGETLDWADGEELYSYYNFSFYGWNSNYLPIEGTFSTTRLNSSLNNSSTEIAQFTFLYPPPVKSAIVDSLIVINNVTLMLRDEGEINIEGVVLDIPVIFYSSTENVSYNSINIYPNPSDGLVQFKNENYTNWQLMDISGKLVAQGNLTKNQENSLTIDQAQGIYFLNLRDEKGNIAVEKLVLNNN